MSDGPAVFISLMTCGFFWLSTAFRNYGDVTVITKGSTKNGENKKRGQVLKIYFLNFQDLTFYRNLLAKTTGRNEQ
jgi:hypothetical protein